MQNKKARNETIWEAKEPYDPCAGWTCMKTSRWNPSLRWWMHDSEQASSTEREAFRFTPHILFFAIECLILF